MSGFSSGSHAARADSALTGFWTASAGVFLVAGLVVVLAASLWSALG